jgi:hypothetical protein
VATKPDPKDRRGNALRLTQRIDEVRRQIQAVVEAKSDDEHKAAQERLKQAVEDFLVASQAAREQDKNG